MESIKNDLIEFICSNFKVLRNEISGNDVLVDMGTINSAGLIILINYIEEKYDIQINDKDISMENFGTINSISKYIEKSKK